MIWESFKILLNLAEKEDLGERGDVTSQAIFTDETVVTRLICKQDGVLAGAEFFREVFVNAGSAIEVKLLKNDGDTLAEGDVVAEVSGKTLDVLARERIALNFISYLSGIATASAAFRNKARKYGKTVILDTRKTLPGYRELAKYAVKVGGASNHRQGLYDMIMIKDNHADAAGSITEAVRKVRDKWADLFPVEVECRNLDEVREAIDNGIEYIMLDNMPPDSIRQAVNLRKGNVKFEISGNIDFEKLEKYAGLGADFISVGKLTHSVVSFDFSLKVKE